MLSLKNLMDNGDMNMDGKVISLTELNEFANMLYIPLQCGYIID